MNPPPKAVTKKFSYGKHDVTLKTGQIARQAAGAAHVSMGDTVILATVVASALPKAGQSFFPLTVDYQERSYAAGKIPGGFFKREGRPSEKEILVSRLIDRSLRPLFPDGFLNEVQIVVTVLSVDPEIDPDIPAMLGACAALMLSGIPFEGPIGAARVGYLNGGYVLNPCTSQMEGSALDLVVAATEEAVLMVESEAKQLSEKLMLDAILFGYDQMQIAIQAIADFADEAGKAPWDWQLPTEGETLSAEMEGAIGSQFTEAYRIPGKQERVQAVERVKTSALAKLNQTDPERMIRLHHRLQQLEALSVRSQILGGQPRIDGRDTRSVRPIDIRNAVLPRTHGSALFTRGETQALVVATLGTAMDMQRIDALTGDYADRFMLHYNFPPYATGETGRVGSPKRREIGHGHLAKRALKAVLPSADDFPYTMRVVSEITESNGSSSMASVCGACLALLDAGVPLKSHVAGVAMGLIKEGRRFAVLTDILGDEDHLGDMDFKVAGTEEGITALQMDIKITGISGEILKVALEQAREGRLHILKLMKENIGERQEISEHAPRMYTMKINPEKIRDVIGKGGANIRALTEETHTQIDIGDDGTVTIASVDAEGAALARRRIEELTAEVEVGATYQGTVLKILEFGAIVNLIPNRDGLLHISQIAHERVNAVTDYLHEGQQVSVKVLELDEKGRVKLSLKALLPAPERKPIVNAVSETL